VRPSVIRYRLLLSPFPPNCRKSCAYSQH
jgi:hypothetical protein